MSRGDREDNNLKHSDSAFRQTKPFETCDPISNTEGDAEMRKYLAPSSASQPFLFLYTRESEKIGAMVPGNGLSSKIQTSSTLARRRAERNAVIEAEFKQMSNLKPEKITAAQILSCYHQGTKIEDPRFTTSSNEYGEIGRGFYF